MYRIAVFAALVAMTVPLTVGQAHAAPAATHTAAGTSGAGTACYNGQSCPPSYCGDGSPNCPPSTAGTTASPTSRPSSGTRPGSGAGTACYNGQSCPPGYCGDGTPNCPPGGAYGPNTGAAVLRVPGTRVQLAGTGKSWWHAVQASNVTTSRVVIPRASRNTQYFKLSASGPFPALHLVGRGTLYAYNMSTHRAQRINYISAAGTYEVRF